MIGCRIRHLAVLGVVAGMAVPAGAAADGVSAPDGYPAPLRVLSDCGPDGALNEVAYSDAELRDALAAISPDSEWYLYSKCPQVISDAIAYGQDMDAPVCHGPWDAPGAAGHRARKPKRRTSRRRTHARAVAHRSAASLDCRP